MADDKVVKPGSLIVAQVVRATSYGCAVHYGEYTGAVTGKSAAAGERIKVLVADLNGRHFHGSRLD
ncbi:MAG TPA: hypothetical protein VIT20_02600 [Propionibacteriaceae bacterium]